MVADVRGGASSRVEEANIHEVVALLGGQAEDGLAIPKDLDVHGVVVAAHPASAHLVAMGIVCCVSAFVDVCPLCLLGCHRDCHDCHHHRPENGTAGSRLEEDSPPSSC